MNKYQCLGTVCGALFFAAANAQTMIDGFEYATTDDLMAAWAPSGNATLSVSDSVAPQSKGKSSMKVEFNFTSVAWATETVRGVELPAPVSIAPSQYVTFRLRGDPQFAAADFRNLYLYAYDADNNFGRWPGTAVPLNDEWQVLNFKADTIALPWDSSTLPDLSRITKFAFFQYGSEGAIDPYSATIYIDDLMVRDTPLNEFPAPSAPRTLLDDFEGYKDDAALQAAYKYQNSPATTATTASLVSPAPQGNKALKLAIDFAAGQWPWGSVWSASVAPFSLPTNAVVSFRFKGDPNLTAIADSGTVIRLSFADKAGRRLDYYSGSAPVISSDWTTLEAKMSDFSDPSAVDLGNLVQWQLLVEGWQGTAEQTALSGAFYFDDLRITVPSASTERPTLAVAREAKALKLNFDHLTSGKSYELRTSTNLSQWSTATTISAKSATDSWTLTPSDQPYAFFQLIEKAP